VITEDENLHLCQFNDEEDDCRYFFTYEYVENNQVKVEVQKTKGKHCMLSSFRPYFIYKAHYSAK